MLKYITIKLEINRFREHRLTLCLAKKYANFPCLDRVYDLSFDFVFRIRPYRRLIGADFVSEFAYYYRRNEKRPFRPLSFAIVRVLNI